MSNRYLYIVASIDLDKMETDVKKLIEKLKSKSKYKDTVMDIDISEYYEAIKLPQTYILVIRNVDLPIPKYRLNIANLISQRIIKKGITILPVLDLDSLLELYEGTPLVKLIEKYGVVVSGG